MVSVYTAWKLWRQTEALRKERRLLFVDVINLEIRNYRLLHQLGEPEKVCPMLLLHCW